MTSSSMFLVLMICSKSFLKSASGTNKGVTRGYKKKAFTQEVRLLPCSYENISACRKKYSLLFSWPRKADTLFKP